MTEQRFDVFLCHHGPDKEAVQEIARRLLDRGLKPWLDVWELRPGLPWQRALEAQIRQIAAAAVFVGDRGIGPWQELEIEAYLRRFVKRDCPVIPVILPGCAEVPELPVFLEGMTWVDFRRDDPEPLEQLIWGVIGRKPGESAAGGGSAPAASAPRSAGAPAGSGPPVTRRDENPPYHVRLAVHRRDDAYRARRIGSSRR